MNEKKVTLRKAAQIISEIEHWLADNKPAINVAKNATKSLDVKAIVDQGRHDLLVNLNNQKALFRIIAEIKNSIGLTNTKVGITELLGTLNGIEKNLYALNSLNLPKTIPSLQEQIDEVNQLLESSGDGYAYSRNVGITFVDKSIVNRVEEEIYLLKKKKAEIADKLTELNSSNHIVIGEASWTLLESLRIV